MTDLPPRRKPYLIMAPEDRIGTPHIPIDPEKVVAVVESDYPDQTAPNAPEDDTSRLVIYPQNFLCNVISARSSRCMNFCTAHGRSLLFFRR